MTAEASRSFSPGPPRRQDPSPRGADALLAEARAAYDRLMPSAALAELKAGEAVLVDIRPGNQREHFGVVAAGLSPLYVDRNVLEWRLDPWGSARLPVASPDARVIVICQQGYQSSLAAHSLIRMGVRRATDVVGGFRAWAEAGLPIG